MARRDASSVYSMPGRSQTTLLPEFSLKNKVCVVSGGARGLGLVQAEALLEAGATGKTPISLLLLVLMPIRLLTAQFRTVHVLDRLPSPEQDPSSGFSEVVKRARRELDTTLTYHQVDVRNVPELNDIMEGIARQSGRLDGVIAAAGVQQETPALEHTAQDTERILSINVTGCFMTVQAAARQMVRLKQPGSICMIASMSGSIANKGLLCPAYNASKAAVLQLGRNLAAEWGQHGIRVNTISPGYIYTNMLQGLFDDYPERKTDWPKQNMLGRFSLPPEYRGAAVFLLSDASSFMTGADLKIDGGHSAW